MKYCVLIIDGAAGWPIKDRGNKTTLELARTPNLDALAREGTLGLTNNVPPGMEPSSAVACMSLLGYDPAVYYRGRAAIEAISMGVPVSRGETVFRCNLVATKGGRMWSYCAGHIESEEAREFIETLNEKLGSDEVEFFPGVGYRHLLKLKGHTDTIKAVCTPPHDIPDKPVVEYLPKGRGSRFLNKLMADSQEVLKHHPVNYHRASRGQIPSTSIWLFWGSGPVPKTPSFKKAYGLKAAITSGVDLLKGLGKMTGMTILNIKGVTDNTKNNFAGQAEGALKALAKHDLVVVHVEAPDEAGHAGDAAEKIEAIQKIDAEIVSRLRSYRQDSLRILVLPDHPTPVPARTHVAEPVPFLMWGPGFEADDAVRFTESEAQKTGVLVPLGHNVMSRFTGRP
ncbi:MAG: cofactor-independent phosphoglycerate mutase [Dehalococcoidia bacterium]|nr:MAG: cofactor-independent phosphoglycerate mutase [Dehalococcoidia bacterium]